MNCKICGAALTEDMDRCPLCASPVETENTPEPEQEARPASEPYEELPDDRECTENEFPADEINFAPPPSRARRLLPVLIPVGLMSLFLILGTVLFFLMPKSTPSQPDKPTAATAPAQTKPPLPPAAGKDPVGQGSGGLRSDDFIPADEDCFRLTDLGLLFLPERYDGGPVLVIPNSIDGEPVRVIAPQGFAGCQGISTVILPDTLEEIGDGAFAGCEDIRGLWMPDSMRRIGVSAFEGCIGIESVAVNAGMEVIGENAFAGCARLLYFFYDGYFDDWRTLYNEYVTPFTSVTCADGDYYHGVETP